MQHDHQCGMNHEKGKDNLMKKTILSSRNLSKSYASDGEQNHVLNGITLDLYQNDFTVVMGSSGSGKSTLLYCLSGMDRVTSGSVIYGGNDITTYNENKLAALRRGEFGFVFQQMHLVSNLTIFENVAVPGYQSKDSAAEVDRKAGELLERVNLSGKVRKRLPSQCSGGEQQRAGIARALINAPGLLFADEPTGALNKQNGTEVLDLLTDFHKAGQSILMVTHDIRAAMRANRILYLEDGSVTGELSLPEYQKEFDKQEKKSRETQISAWLTSLKW